MKLIIELSTTMTMIVQPDYDQVIVWTEDDDGLRSECMTIADLRQRIFAPRERLSMVTREDMPPDFISAKTLLEHVRAAGPDGIQLTALSQQVKGKYRSVSVALLRMLKDGKVRRIRPGRYAEVVCPNKEATERRG